MNKLHISDNSIQLHGLLQTSSVDREEKSEVSSTSSCPARASGSCLHSESSFRGLVPVREDDKKTERQQTKKRGRDKQTDVRITNHIHLMLDNQMAS